MSVASLAARAVGDPRSLTVDAGSDRDAADWDRFVTAHSDASGYHLWAWREVFARAFGHESIYLITREGARIAGVLPLVFIDSIVFGRSLTSLPFLNYGGIAADSAEAAAALIEAAVAIARDRRCGHVELRHLGRRFPQLPCKEHKVTMKLRLEAGLWDRLDRKVRNQIRKAQKSELTSEHGGAELLGDFYRVFARNMRDLGTPVYGRGFFEAIFQTFAWRTRIHVVRLKGAPIAAAITYRTGTTIEVPWASSVRDHNALCPNHLLYWGVIETAVAEGCNVLDFGRSTPHEGTYRFKEQWGALPVALHWEYGGLNGKSVPNTSPTNPKFRLAIALWKKLPLSVAGRIGPMVVKSIP